MEHFEFKIFFSIYRGALKNKTKTKSVKKLFEPIMELCGPFSNDPNNKEDDEYLEIDGKKASEWTRDRRVREDVASAPLGNKEVFDAIVLNFKDEIIPNDMNQRKVDNTLKELYDTARRCGFDGEIGDDIAEKYAQLFVFSLSVDAGLNYSRSEKDIGEVLSEYEQAIRNKYKKPRINIPNNVANEEMNYVNQLLSAYQEATGELFEVPEDLKGTEYENHFRQQRKNYYQAEVIHREIRDVVRKDEDEGFDVLKEEIEDGIYTVSHKKYKRGIDKADTVLDAAGMLPISQRTEDNMLGWVGSGEKRGICHMLVNEKRMKWMEDGEDEG